jgi:hypothetical protein
MFIGTIYYYYPRPPRLLRHKPPETNTIDIFSSDIFFANVVTVLGDTDKIVIYISETSLAGVL